MVCLLFTKSSVSAAELNLELKPQANYIKISLNFTYVAISPPIERIWSFNWFWGDLLIVHYKLCLYGKIEPQIKTSSKKCQNKLKFDIWCDLTPNRLSMNFNWFWGGLFMFHQKLFFCGKNWIILEISTALSLSLSLSLNILIWFYSNKMKYNLFFFFLLRWRRHKEQEDGCKHWKT